jgi:hypothetical protein
MKRIALGLALAAGMSASAQELPILGHTEPNHTTIYGHGNNNCRDLAGGGFAFVWLEGFISGAEATATVAAQEMNGAIQWPIVTADTMRTWANNYCSANPRATVSDTAAALLDSAMLSREKRGQ